MIFGFAMLGLEIKVKMQIEKNLVIIYMIQEIDIELKNNENTIISKKKKENHSFFNCSDTEKVMICGVISWYVILFVLFFFY